MGQPVKVECAAATPGNSPLNIPLTIAAAVGDPIMVAVETAYIGGTTPTVTGSLNGAYSLLASRYDATIGIYQYIFGVIATVAGVDVPTISTASGGSFYFTLGSAIHWNNLAAAAFDVSFPAYFGTGTSAVGSPVTNFANEGLFALASCQNYMTGPAPAGWTSADLWDTWYISQIATGTSCAFSDPLNASGAWSVIMVGVYDKPAGQLAGTPSDASSAAAALTTHLQFAGSGSDSSIASGTLQNFKSVTLTAPLALVQGSLLDPNAIWTDGAPTVGTIVQYDGSHLTIEPDGSLVGDINQFTALCQWNNGGTYSQLLIAFVPDLGSEYGIDNSVATGILRTGVTLASAAGDLSYAAASLSTFQPIAAAASSLSSATGALTTAIQLAVAALDSTTASGALSTFSNLLAGASSNSTATGSLSTNTGGIALKGTPSDISSAVATLSTQIRVAAAAVDVSTAAAVLSSHILLSGSGIDSSIAVGVVDTSTIFHGSAVSASAAAAALSTVISLAAAASDASAAAAAIVTHVNLVASAADIASGAGFLSTLDPIRGAAASISSGAASLTIAAHMMAQAVSDSQAPSTLSTGINLIGGGTSNDAAYGNLTAVGAGVFSDAVIVKAPPKNATGAVQLIFGIFNQRVGELIAYGINWDAWLAASWEASQPTTQGQTIRPTVANGLQARCETPGETGGTEPAWPAYAGGQVLDGSTVWQMETVDATSLNASIAQSAWSAADPAIALTMQAVRGDITLAGVDTTNAVTETAYDVLCTAQLSDSEVKTGKLRIRVQ